LVDPLPRAVRTIFENGIIGCAWSTRFGEVDARNPSFRQEPDDVGQKFVAEDGIGLLSRI
jgi:hypothetical protein